MRTALRSALGVALMASVVLSGCERLQREQPLAPSPGTAVPPPPSPATGMGDTEGSTGYSGGKAAQEQRAAGGSGDAGM